MKIEALSDWHGELIHRGRRVGYLYKNKNGYTAEVNYQQYQIKKADSKHLIEWLEAIVEGNILEWNAERNAEKRGFKILY
jgi:translation elongation factor P/translation initiation factor 5A